MEWAIEKTSTLRQENGQLAELMALLGYLLLQMATLLAVLTRFSLWES